MPQQYIDFAYVKQNASFERVIAGYNLRLLGKGSERSLLCPFHKERKASCKVDLPRGIWHCFGCEAKGNILEFVARLEGDPDDLRAASLKIAELCGIATAPPREVRRETQTSAPQTKAAAKARAKDGSDKSERNAPARARRNADRAAGGGNNSAGRGNSYSTRGDNSAGEHRSADRNNPNTARLTDRQIHGEAVVNPPLTFALKLDPEHPYLAERGLSAQLIAEFGVGYCGRGSMAGRICFPIHDAAGQLVAYAGRWPGEPPEEIERYLLPAKFEKSRVLYNLNRVADTEHVVLVEGYWSTIRLHGLGVPVVALMGSSISAEQIVLLREHGIRFVTLLLDGDDAGRRGRERVLPDLSAEFFVSAPLLPDGEKPDTVDEELLLEIVSSPNK